MPKPQKGKNEVSYIEAAYKVLEKEKGALHYKEITKQAKENWGLISDGETPWQTMYAAINEDIKKKCGKSDFEKIEKGIFSLCKFGLGEQSEESIMLKPQNGDSNSSFIEAIFKILEQEKKPLHIREIANKSIKQGLINSSGKTPWHTIGSYIYTDIKENGIESKFVKIRKATFALRKFDISKQQQLASNKKKISGRSFLECAEKVLENSGGMPMDYKDITKEAIEKWGLSSIGKTPEETMRVAITNDIKNKELRGEEALFERLGKGLFGIAVLNDGLEDSEFKKQAAEHKRKIREELRRYLMGIDPREFEIFIGEELLKSMGFRDIIITKRTGDGGVDVLATLVIREGVEIEFAVQVKRWENNVRLNDVRALRGAVGVGGEYEKRQKILITTSKFAPGAIKEAKLESIRPISLVDGEEIIDIMLEKRIGVSCIEVEIFEIKEEYSYFNNTEDKS